MQAQHSKDPTYRVNGRYQLSHIIGSGGMGVVHLATDRLTQQEVALKRINVDLENLDWLTSISFGNNLQLTLAREFQILAGLRHPHIISVRDYGFDEKNDPFYTMDYLEDPKTVITASEGLPTQEKLELIRQVLQALAYLHFRGVLHRDLKPKNILVKDGIVRLVDFGLASYKGQNGSSGGTLLYMSPEMLDKEIKPFVEATDLYSLGVIIYEMLVGDHPFDIQSGDFIEQVATQPPDLTKLDTTEPVRQVIGRLLAKKAEDRYENAYQCLGALDQALGYSLENDDEAIRNSFIQAADFIGREEEMEQLEKVLRNAQDGEGSSWIIGGESGVGKSRLINEIRTLAMINGMQVLRGEERRNAGDIAYQFLRTPLQHLLLTRGTADLQDASLLKPLVPNIEKIIDRSVPTQELTEGSDMRRRMYKVISDLFKTQSRPILFIVEDLQGNEENLALINHLAQELAAYPVLILCSYRNDENPDLPAQLTAVNQILLSRLNSKEITRLSEAILGETGKSPKILDFLTQETEGNPFFIIEVMRTLAEVAGRTRRINPEELPEQIFPSGIQTIVNRRLENVPQANLHWLEIAAISGRQLDLPLLNIAFGKEADIETWLLACAEAAVLEVEEDTWQFTHEKIREGLITTLAETVYQDHHRKVAEAIEIVYADDSSIAASLYYHWSEAGNIEKRAEYAYLAGLYSMEQYANHEAITFLNDALLHFAPNAKEKRFDCLLAREHCFDRLGNRPAQKEDLNQLETTAAQLAQLEKRAAVALRRAHFEHVTGNFNEMILSAQKGVSLAVKMNNSVKMAEGYLLWGTALRLQTKFDLAEMRLKEAIKVAESINNQRILSDALGQLSMTLSPQRRDDEALEYAKRSLSLSQSTGDKVQESYAWYHLGWILEAMFQYDETNDAFEQALAITREIEYRRGESMVLTALGDIQIYMGRFDDAQRNLMNGLQLNEEVGDKGRVGENYLSLAMLNIRLGQYEEAESYAIKALDNFKLISDRWGESLCFYVLGRCRFNQASFEDALSYLLDSFEIINQVGDKESEVLVLNSLGHISLRLNQTEQAYHYFLESRSLLKDSTYNPNIIEAEAGLAKIEVLRGDIDSAKTRILSILDEFLSYSLDGRWHPFATTLLIYGVLLEVEDQRASQVLTYAQKVLNQWASNISKAADREFFLKQIPNNRKILTLLENT